MPPPAQGLVSMVPFTTATLGVPRGLSRSLPMWRRPPPREAPKSSLKASGSVDRADERGRAAIRRRWTRPGSARLVRGNASPV